MRWVKDHQPDAIISQELGLLEVLQQNGYRVPQDIGFAAQSLTSYAHTRQIAGFDENAMEAGAVAVNLLVGMMHRGEWGIPQLTQNILIKGTWREGDTVARQNVTTNS
jgi:DNA-binding LacI/PurR family transcriptional regulator